MDKRYKITVYFAHGIDVCFEGPDFTEEHVQAFEDWWNRKSEPTLSVQVNNKTCHLDREFACAWTVEKT